MNIAHEYSRYSHSALENTPMSQVVHKRIRELPPPPPLGASLLFFALHYNPSLPTRCYCCCYDVGANMNEHLHLRANAPFPGMGNMQVIQIKMQGKPMFGVVGVDDVDKVGEGI